MIEKPTLIRMIQMIDVRRRWGLFCAGAEARGGRAGMVAVLGREEATREVL